MPKQWRYSVHPGVAMGQNVALKMKEKSGRSLAEWLTFIEGEGPREEEERRVWLKEAHGLGTNYASWLAEASVGKGKEHFDPDEYLESAHKYVEDMLAGPKAALRPIYDAVMERAFALGPDIRVCPAKTIVPIYRNHVIAQFKPSTRTRVDLGFALADQKSSGRLTALGAKAKGNRISHVIAVTAPAEVDGEVEKWLQRAYTLDA